MTYDDDFVRLNLVAGTVNVTCKELNLQWPPPDRIAIDGENVREATADDPIWKVMIMDRMSEITDEQREGMTHVARGAEYFYEMYVKSGQ
jgi:hypothetical protein